MTLDFGILGPLEVRDGDRRIEVRGAKLRTLLAVLLLHAGEVVSRDRLVDAIWGDDPPPSADKALQMHVSHLRRLLEPDRAHGAGSEVLVTTPPGYLLRVADDRLDLRRFERRLRDAAAAETPAQAARLLRLALDNWRGPPLCDLEPADALRGDRARLEEQRLRALEDRIDADLATGGHADVIAELEALVEAEPLRERLRAQLMLALYRSGRQAEALALYRDTRRALVDELGIEPGRELRELERRILAQDPELEPAPVAVELVGRGRELTELRDIVDRALAGRFSIVLVGGEPGIGKSRLAEALARHADAQGAAVAVGRCWEAGGAPAYWPWVQALRAVLPEDARDLVGGADAGELAALLPELGDGSPRPAELPDDGSDAARFRLFAAVAGLLRRVTDARPVALFLDDLHAADPPSIVLLRFVAGELARARLVIVGCYRDTEVGTALAETLPELARSGPVRRLSLRGLDREDTARLLAQTIGSVPPSDLATRVHSHTDGNPLFAVEIGRLLATEVPGAVDGERLPIPEEATGAIVRRLERRSASCRDVLLLASVLGREFDVGALERVSGLGEDELAEALEEAAAARLVGDVPGMGGRLRFSHILVRDALYDSLPGVRRMRLHRRVAGALEARYARNLEPHLAELAHHYLHAGSHAAAEAVEYATRAGDVAAAQHGYEEAARHYRSALRVLETEGAGDADRACELLLSLGEVLTRAGEERESKQALLHAATLAEQAGRPDRLARAAISYGWSLVWTRASTDPALVPLLERALAAVGDSDDAARARLLTRLSAACRDDPSRDRRVALADEAVALATRVGDPRLLARALAGRWVAAEGPDTPAEERDVADRLLALTRQIGDKEQEYAARELRLARVWMASDRTAVEVELDAVTAVAEELRQPAQLWAVGTCRTMLALMEGRFADAEALIAGTLALGRAAASWNATVSERVALFVLRREQGRLAELEATIDRSVHEYPAQLRFRCAQAHLYAELGREREARTCLDGVLAEVRDDRHVDAEWLFSMSLLPDVCAALFDASAAAELEARLAPYERLYAAAPVEAVFGSVARALAVLAVTMGRPDAAEAHFETAIATERRMRARPWLAHAQHGLAELLITRGESERAAALLGEAEAAYKALGMDTWATRCAAPARRG